MLQERLIDRIVKKPPEMKKIHGTFLFIFKIVLVKNWLTVIGTKYTFIF